MRISGVIAQLRTTNPAEAIRSSSTKPGPRAWPRLLVVAACLIAGHAEAESAADVDFRTKAVFELVVRESSVLRAGASKIVAHGAFVTRARGLAPGNSDGLEIQFFTTPVTDAAKTEILRNRGRGLRKSDYAALVLFLGRDGRIWQVNLSYVVPGTTVARTVAWSPEELAKSFSSYRFDGKRLILKSDGSYSETESGRETMRLSWNVDVDLPVLQAVE